MSDKPIALVVTTLGRVDALERLLESCSGQLQVDDELVLVVQDRLDEVRDLVKHFPNLPIRIVQSSRGATLGRNVGVEQLHGRDLPVLFPNDTSNFQPGMINRIREAIAVAPIGAITVVDSNGPKFILPSPDTTLNRINVWKVIEPGLFIRSSLFLSLGGFDTSIGTGAPSPWQAGEAGDLLLRYLSTNDSPTFKWVSPDVYVSGVTHEAGLTSAERRKKQRAYARGFGYLTSRWKYPIWFKLAILAHGLFGGLLSRTGHVSDGIWVCLGRFEGLIGKTFGNRSSHLAVTK